MIPPKVIRFLQERASVGFAGTRDDNLVPRGHRISGWQADASGRTITVFIPTAFTAGLIEALRSNGQIAITVEETGTNETYQIKGQYLRDRAVRPDEIDIASRARERFVRSVAAMYPGEPVAETLRASIAAPSLAVEVEVRE